MAIYRIVGDKEKLDEVDTTSFGQEGVLERSDLQRMLRDQPKVLEEGLLIIAEEFSDWENSKLRIDLLGLDAGGQLVVIELKRGETGSHMDLQAIRYAAMVANMGHKKVIETYQGYLDERTKEKGETEEAGDAETRIREHLGEDPAIRTETPRIILASEKFGKELTTCVMWLNDSWLSATGQEIKCVRLQPHRNGNEILIETSVVIPLPEASDYRTRLAQRKEEAREQEDRGPSSGKLRQVPGGDAFRESISKAPERFQQGLKRLYDCAVDLEEEKLADLATYINAKQDYIRLELRIPGGSAPLVSFNNLLDRGGRGGGISFWPTQEGAAPKSLSQIDDLIGPATSPSGVRHRMLSVAKTADSLDKILAAIGEVYREANVKQMDAGAPGVEQVAGE